MESLWLTCQYCLEQTEEDVGETGAPKYPSYCPNCKVCFCIECGTPLKVGQGYCHACGEIAPDTTSPMVRTSSTAAAYAEQNWQYRTQLWNNDRGQVAKYELWTDVETGDVSLKHNKPTEEGRETIEVRALSEGELERYDNHMADE